MTGSASRTSPPEETRESQPQQSEETRLRRLRTRPTTQRPVLSSQNELGSRSKASSSIKSESAESRRSASASRPSTMSHTLTAEPPRLTKTGRISKAKKGVKGAHVCLRCGKKYSRNEHLKRHEYNHDPAKLQCSWPNCGRSFARQDLLDRHEQKHSEVGGSRRLSSVSGSSSNQGEPEIKTSRPPSRTASRSGLQPGEHAPPIQGDSRREAPRSQAVTPATRYSQAFRHDSLQFEPPFSPSASLSNSPEGLATSSKTIPLHLPSGPHAYPLEIHTDPHPTIPSQSQADFDFFFSSSAFSASVTSPWIPFTTPDFATPFGSFSEITLDQAWTGFPSTSISPLPSTPHFPWAGGFEPDPGSFPLSGASSPRSQHAVFHPVKMPPTVTGSVPYPLPWGGHRDPYGGLEIEGVLEEQQLGINLGLKKKQHYVEAYWKHFHPLFPILHRHTYQKHRTNPLFSAAVMAIGAQYCDQLLARTDSRILHEKCQELIAKEQYREGFKSTTQLEYMQAIFLVEFLSHFKAKRATTAMSDVFNTMYDQLWQRHRNEHHLSIGRTQLDGLLVVQDGIPDQELRDQWRSWIEAHSIERLLVACYILESQVALLLVRPESQPRPADCGSDLYMPMPTALWEASSHLSWAQRLRSFTRIPPTIDVFQQLDNVINSAQTQTLQYDDFTSSLLIACHANSILSQSQADISPYFSQVHPLFTPQHSTTLQRVLSPTPYIQLQHQLVLLSSFTPFKALLAVSGKSYVLSQKLSQVISESKGKFEGLKTELRFWTTELQPTLQTLYPVMPPHAPSTAPSSVSPANSRALHSLEHALRIISFSLDSAPSLPIFGPEIGLYYATLVLWAVTFSSSPRTESEDSSTASTPVLPNFDPGETEDTIRSFLAQAEHDIHESMVVGEAVPSLAAVERWKDGVQAILRWSAWILNGAPPSDEPGASGAGVGELIGTARDVLERLARRGFDENWF